MKETYSKWLQRLARYFLVGWLLICVIDGWAYIFFDEYLTGKPSTVFLSALMNTMWFWVALKIVQTLGVLSLLTNYKPALGLAILAPISAIMCLFYFFILVDFIPVAILIIISYIYLLKIYSQSFIGLFKSYPG